MQEIWCNIFFLWKAGHWNYFSEVKGRRRFSLTTVKINGDGNNAPPNPQKPPFPAYAPKGDECRIRQKKTGYGKKKEHKAILTSIKNWCSGKAREIALFIKKVWRQLKLIIYNICWLLYIIIEIHSDKC